jgi:hypothetical protein
MENLATWHAGNNMEAAGRVTIAFQTIRNVTSVPLLQLELLSKGSAISIQELALVICPLFLLAVRS